MPDRMIRDELLTSERYWSCSPEARNLYVAILLSADDTARYTASNFALRTKCMAGTVSAERIDRLLAELVDCDMVRLYEVDGARYVFVPRYRQRLRFSTSKYPEPPIGISDLTIKKTDSRPTRARLKTAEEKRREEKKTKGSAFALPLWVPAGAWCDWIASRKNKPSAKAKSLAIAELEKLRAAGNDPEAVLNQSTYRGWTGLFPVKDAPPVGVKVDA